MKLAAAIWGFQVTGKLNIATGTNLAVPVPEKYNSAVEKAVRRFYGSIAGGSKPHPDILSLTVFKYRRKYYKNYPSTYDAEYWKSKGWLEPGKKYFCDASINPLYSAAAWVITAIIGFTTTKAP
jgi:hypothetical protein